MKAAPGWRKLLSPLAYHSGAWVQRWQAQAGDEGLTAVLCYHRVVDSPERRKAGLTVDEGVTVATFEAQMRFMLRHFEPVLPSQAAALSLAGRPRFAVTFDDGYADNAGVAAPVLTRLGIPAAFYVVSACVGTQRRFWWDRLAAMLRSTQRTELPLAGLLPAGEEPPAWPAAFDLRDDVAKRVATDRIGAAVRGLAPGQIGPVIERLAELLDADDQAPPADQLMDWSQVRQLVSAGFEIGAHSADHFNLARISELELERQVAGAKARIEAETGTPVRSFAYPYGGPAHVTSAVQEAVRRAGFECAFTAVNGVVTGADELTSLPRLALNWPHAFACAYNVETARRAGP
jgi:peptidoglycan/xylan/chitin deacetylase (PgdA/CDA1 family)